jgi:energy-coupling factor transporter ATP-binding protein EcfA2
MNVRPDDFTIDRTALDAEWSRIGLLLTMAEAARTGVALVDDFSNIFNETTERVSAARESGTWLPLRQLVPESLLEDFVQLDLDILACTLAAEARPALAPRFQSLQPQINEPKPSLALLQELLMLDDGHEVASLYDRLEPAAPLAASGLVRLTGNGAYQCVSPAPIVTRTLLDRATDLSPPPGAHLVTGQATWDDLILPDASLAALLDFSSWVRNRDLVISDWGARPIGGPLVLFCGPSGSGKSYAATIIASHLTEKTGHHWSLYALDLGRIMSKYVGETEQNLNALLDALDGRRALLQIDEADGLLGKRGEITDARDRYANLEVSHMLSRFERHSGPVILTTNLRSNIDAAFLRRFQQIVDFPAPDEAARKTLWERLLPKDAPRAEHMDAGTIASAARLSGGAIHNAAFFASVLASEAGEPISERHLARAVWAEINKDNRQVRQSELGALAEHLEETP